MKKVSILNIVSNLLLGILTIFGGIQFIKFTNVGIGATSTLQDIVKTKYFAETFQGYLMIILGIMLAIISILNIVNLTKKSNKAFESFTKIRFSLLLVLLNLLVTSNLIYLYIILGAEIYTTLTISQALYLVVMTILNMDAVIDLLVYAGKLPKKPRVKKEKVKKEKIKKVKVKKEKPVKQASTRGRKVSENNINKPAETKPSFVSFKQVK